MAQQPLRQTPPTCDHCGLAAYSGYEIRSGEVEPDTGYRDEEVWCNRCLDEVEADADDYSDWMADMAYDLGVEG